MLSRVGTLVILLSLAAVGFRCGECVLATGTPPSITEQPRNIYVSDSRNDTLEFECIATGDPTPNITWYREGVALESNVLANGTLLVQFTPAKVLQWASREGTTYYCTATNKFGTVRSHNVTAFVAYFDGFVETRDRVQVNMSTGSDPEDRRDVALACNITGVSPPIGPPGPDTSHIVWYRVDTDTEVIPTELANPRTRNDGRFLIFVGIEEADVGDYRCEVINPVVGTNTSNTVFEMNNIGDALPFTVYKHIENVVANSGDDIMFSHVVGFGMRDPRYDFFRNGVQSLFSLGPLANLNDVMPANVEPDVLRCDVINVESEPILFKSTLTVQSPAVIDTPQSDVLDHFTGIEIVFSCPSSGRPDPGIVWYHNRIMVENAPGVNDFTLRLPSPTLEQSGVYQCFVSNAAGLDSASWAFDARDMVVPATVGFPVGSVKPRQGNDQPVGLAVFSELGEPATVTWNVKADPCPTVVWQRDGVNLDALPGPILNDTTLFEPNDPCDPDKNLAEFMVSLTVTNVNEDTKGEYVAFLSNPVEGAAQVGTVSTAPVFVTPEESVKIKELRTPPCLLDTDDDTDVILLECISVGFPLPNITFNRNGAPVDLTDDGYSMPYYDTLAITNVQPSHGGNYRCVAENIVSEQKQDDESPREINLPYCTLPSVTKFDANNGDVRIDQETSLTLLCTATGIPTPNITFAFEHEVDLVESNPPALTIDRAEGSATLNIFSVTEDDAGDYFCIASNPAGSVSLPLMIEVITPSDPLSLGVIIGIACGAGGGIVLLFLFIITIFVVWVCARRSRKGEYPTHTMAYSTDFTDGRGNVDKDSDEEDAGQPEPFQPTYESLPVNRPTQPPQYKPTPSYPHGAPLTSDDIEMVKVPPPDTDSYLGTFPRQDNGNVPPYRPTVEDFMSEDAQFV